MESCVHVALFLLLGCADGRNGRDDLDPEVVCLARSSNDHEHDW